MNSFHFRFKLSSFFKRVWDGKTYSSQPSLTSNSFMSLQPQSPHSPDSPTSISPTPGSPTAFHFLHSPPPSYTPRSTSRHSFRRASSTSIISHTNKFSTTSNPQPGTLAPPSLTGGSSSSINTYPLSPSPSINRISSSPQSPRKNSSPISFHLDPTRGSQDHPTLPSNVFSDSKSLHRNADAE